MNATEIQPPLSGTTQTRSEPIDLQSYWRTLVRRRWLMLSAFVVVVLAGAILTLRATKIYDAVCTVIIDVSAPKVFEKDQVQDVVETGSAGYWSYREYAETQYRVITSRAVAERVAARLQLGLNPRFLAGRKDPISILQKNLRVEPAKESRIVRLRYEDPDPEIAALVANAFADAYVAENLAVRSSTTQNASDWLEGQLAGLERKLEESGKALYEFKRQHDIVATSWEDRQGMISQRLTLINDALTRAQVRRAELQARNDAIGAVRTSLENGTLTEAEIGDFFGKSAALDALKVRFFEAKAECADMVTRYLSQHPKLDSCEKRVAEARKALGDEIRGMVEQSRRELDEVVRSEQNMRTLLGQTKTDAFGLNQYERDYLELKRANDNNQRLYDLLLKRLKDTGVAGMLQVSNVRVLDRARPSLVPARPQVAQNVLTSVLLGLLGAIALAFIAEYLDKSITGQEQIEEKLKLAFLGVIPRIDPDKDGGGQDLHIYNQPKSAAAECLRAIRTNILFMSPEKQLRTLLVTSSAPQEGKTTAATSLAITMAGSGHRVLLVDADMRRPRVHRVFGIRNDLGLSTLTLGEGDLEQAAQPTAIPNLFVLPSGPIPPNPAELLHTTTFRRLLEQMENRFDRVIIDSPPVGAVADALVIATHADGTVFVARMGKTSRDLAKRAVRQLHAVKGTLVGAILNDLDVHDPRYGYYSYYYRYGYSADSRGEPGAKRATGT